jgi:hypothetical protein
VRLGAEQDWMPSLIDPELPGARSKSRAGRAHLAACIPPDGYRVLSTTIALEKDEFHIYLATGPSLLQIILVGGDSRSQSSRLRVG